MELSKQVCSRELAEKLKELGFPQNSLFYWSYGPEDDIDLTYGLKKENIYLINISAYTVAELGEMLKEIMSNISEFWQSNGKLCIGYEIVNPVYLYADTEADARAKMLIYLAENNLINPKEIKL